jgi:hypothetical protein
MNSSEPAKRKAPERVTDVEIDHIRESLKGRRYGVLQIIVQDGVIVQIDRTEKRRLRRPDRPDD